MSATIIILPVIRIERYDEDARALETQEMRVALDALVGRTAPRARPELVVDNTARRR